MQAVNCTICLWGMEIHGEKAWCHKFMSEHPLDDCCPHYEDRPKRSFGPKPDKPSLVQFSKEKK